jgi:hypothetical protein
LNRAQIYLPAPMAAIDRVGVSRGGNRVSLLDTKALFEHGRGDANNPDITMLLNHKEAIEFMVDAVPEQGITVPVVRNLHGLLMQGLLSDPLAAGAIRRRIVTIEGSV